MPNTPTEYEEACVLSEWLRLNNIPHWHSIQENTIKNPAYLGKMKRQGWNPGFPDYFIVIPAEKSFLNRPLMLFLELKRPRPRLKSGRPSRAKGRVSQEQLDFLDMVNVLQDVGASVCYGAQESIAWVDGYMK